MPAGTPPPAPSNLDGVPVAHAIDGDGTALCSRTLAVEQVDACTWPDVPGRQRCGICEAITSQAT
jgi:hypothetical protein